MTVTEKNPGIDAPARARPDQRHVLIVDDDAVLRTQISHYLTDQGIACLEAEDGTHAIEALEAHHPEVVLLDIKMPDISGIDVAGIVSDLEPRPKIILMSGYIDAVNEAKRANLEVFAVIEKPVPLRVIGHFLDQAFTADEAPEPETEPNGQG